MGIVDVVGINTPSKKDLYPENYNNKNFYDVNTYLTLARRSILKFASRYMNHLTVQGMLNSEDVISNIATDIMMAHWKFNGTGSQEAYLIQCSIYSITKYIRRRKNNSKKKNIFCISLNESLEQEKCISLNNMPEKEAILKEEYDIFIKGDLLSNSEKECIIMYYLDCYSQAEIGRKRRVSRQRIGQILDSATNKLMKARL